MGLFLSAVGVIDKEAVSVGHAIEAYAQRKSGSFEYVEGSPEEDGTGVLAEQTGNVTVLLPHDFLNWDQLAKELSSQLSTSVFSLHIHDGDLWMFLLFRDGSLITQFNPLPDYWAEVSDQEKASWRGDAHAIANAVNGVDASSIERYLVPWTDEALSSEQKAYADDEFPIGLDWQMTDFMRRVGLPWPDDVELDSQRTFRLKVRAK
jgi:hypothetical protein